MDSGPVKAVGVWFLAQHTHSYLYLLRNDHKKTMTWGLPGGKILPDETLLGGMERECTEELGLFPAYNKLVPLEKFTTNDGKFEYNTWVCVIDKEFQPTLNAEHHGYAWIQSGVWPRPMHPGLWSTVNISAIMHKLSAIEKTERSVF